MTRRYARTLVVGGGIGGLATAIALRQAGSEVDLVEIKPRWSVAGVGLIQPINALRALARLGVADDCLAAGFAYWRYRYTDVTGRVLNAAPGPEIPGSGLPPYNGIERSALHRILRARAETLGAVLRLGQSVQELAQDADGVTVLRSDGHSARYELVVAAEGIYSPMRSRLFGVAHEPQATGQSVWRLTLPRPAGMDDGIMMLGPASKAGFIPLGVDSMYLLLVTQEPPTRHFADADLAASLHQRLQPFGGLVEQIKACVVPGAPIVYRPLEVVRLPSPWYQGRVVMIGDAAHAATPHLGQGAAMAVEDALVLGELVAQQLPPDELGERYMDRRHARASFIQEASIAIGEYELGRRPGLDLFGLLAEARERLLQEP